MVNWCAFPTWREQWSSLNEVPQLIDKADKLLRQRRTGNQRMPQGNTQRETDQFTTGVAALRDLANGNLPPNNRQYSEIVRRTHEAVSPALRANNWPRWLLLERAFLNASETGDLLFAGLVLRTMCEEVQRLHALDLDADELANLAGSDSAEKHKRLKLFFAVAWTSLDRLSSEMVLDGKEWPKLSLMAKLKPDLEAARAALNSYVHPNYGSHIVALYPESASAARLLLSAVVCIYEAFFALSWSGLPIYDPSRAMGTGPLRSWQHSARQLLSRTLPELRRFAGDQALSEGLELPTLTEWLGAEHEDSERLLQSAEMVPLLSDLPRASKSGASADDASSYLTWAGARPTDVLQFAAARRAEQLLADEFPSGAPDTDDQVRWLKFNAKSLQLAMLIDETKGAAFRTQLVRQLTQENPVAVWLLVRSLIEHRALATWLPNQVKLSLDALASDLTAGAPLPEEASEIAQPIANFLAAQAMKSGEDQRAWVLDERGDVRNAWLNLGNVVKEGFAEGDRFHVIYSLASAVLHGRLNRGYDLMLNFARATRQTNHIGILVLERICNRDEKMDHLSLAFAQWARLNHAADFGGTQAAPDDAMARQVFGDFEGTLTFGTDYSGQGTADSPFYIETHLQFHPASYSLLRQMGGDPGKDKRTLECSSEGYLCDRWSTSDRDFWFRLPQQNARE
jgi:hypothetical protein